MFAPCFSETGKAPQSGVRHRFLRYRSLNYFVGGQEPNAPITRIALRRLIAY
jgi:hypothetical protein